MMAKVCGALTALALIFLMAAPALAGGGDSLDDVLEEIGSDDAIMASTIGNINDIPARSGILVEQSTGKVLFEKNADEKMAPASITKVMTLLLVMEALDNGRINLDDMVTCSQHASSMGGSQIWLEIGEQMSVDMLLKAAAIASANDASVALAEHIAGSEEAFVSMMNEKAAQLGMYNTNFVNASGLDAEGHYTTARDIAIMSIELVNYERIRDYSTIWMDYLRDGETLLTNTNRLIRFYDGITGLKTGTTDSAGSCLSATATRNNLSLVAVVLGSPTSDDRFNSARFLLDHGFANYIAVEPPAIDEQLVPVKVTHGIKDEVGATYSAPTPVVVNKADKGKITQEIAMVENLQAPVEKGQTIGVVTVRVNGEKITEYRIRAAEEVPRMNFGRALIMLINSLAKLK